MAYRNFLDITRSKSVTMDSWTKEQIEVRILTSVFSNLYQRAPEHAQQRKYEVQCDIQPE